MMVALFIFLTIVLFAAVWFLLPFALRKCAEAKLQAKCKELRAIVLSYDDGPGSTITPKLLDLLDRHEIQASFFVLGKSADGQAEALDRIVAAKHDLGSHTFDHTNAWKSAPWLAHGDIQKGIRVIETVGGNPRLFRPPYGKVTLAGLLLCQRIGLHIAWWTIDSRDSWNRKSIDDVVAEIETKGGGVVLMHDFDSYPKAPQLPSHAEYVLSLTAEIISLARRGNYRVVPYSTLFSHSGKNLA